MKYIAISKQVINGVEVNSVGGRELYDNLGLDKSQFLRWSKKNIIDNVYAAEGHDYIIIDIMSKGKEIKDYVVSIDFANKLAMMARSEEGEGLRSYFVKIEKQYKKEVQKDQLLELTEIKHKMQCMFEYNDKMGEVVTDHNKRIKNLEFNTRMESWQEKNLLDAKARTVYKLANNDDKLAKKLHVNVWRAFKKRFNIPRYNSLTTGKYEDGIVWLDNVQLHEVV